MIKRIREWLFGVKETINGEAGVYYTVRTRFGTSTLVKHHTKVEYRTWTSKGRREQMAARVTSDNFWLKSQTGNWVPWHDGDRHLDQQFFNTPAQARDAALAEIAWERLGAEDEED